MNKEDDIKDFLESFTNIMVELIEIERLLGSKSNKALDMIYDSLDDLEGMIGNIKRDIEIHLDINKSNV